MIYFDPETDLEYDLRSQLRHLESEAKLAMEQSARLLAEARAHQHDADVLSAILDKHYPDKSAKRISEMEALVKHATERLEAAERARDRALDIKSACTKEGDESSTGRRACE